MPNTGAEKLRVALQTCDSGGNLLHESSSLVTLTCPSRIVPTIGDIKITKINDADGELVKDVSSVEVSVTGCEGVMGSTVKSVWVAVGDDAGNSPLETGILRTSGDIPVSICVTDSRGNSALIMQFITVTEHGAPLINAMAAERCDADGTPNTQGQCGRVMVSYSYNTDEEITDATATIRRRASGLAQWVKVYEGALASGEWMVLDEVTLNIDQSYDIEVTITDANGKSVTGVTGIGTAYVFMRWEPLSDIISFGCYPHKGMTKCLQISDDWKFLIGDRNFLDVVYPLGSVLFIHGEDDPSETIGGSWATIGALALGGQTITAWKKTGLITVL